MLNTQIKKILDMHSVPHYEKNGHVFADSMISGKALFEEVIDFTNCTKKDLYEFLGY